MSQPEAQHRLGLPVIWFGLFALHAGATVGSLLLALSGKFTQPELTPVARAAADVGWATFQVLSLPLLPITLMAGPSGATPVSLLANSLFWSVVATIAIRAYRRNRSIQHSNGEPA